MKKSWISLSAWMLIQALFASQVFALRVSQPESPAGLEDLRRSLFSGLEEAGILKVLLDRMPETDQDESPGPGLAPPSLGAAQFIYGILETGGNYRFDQKETLWEQAVTNLPAHLKDAGKLAWLERVFLKLSQMKMGPPSDEYVQRALALIETQKGTPIVPSAGLEEFSVSWMGPAARDAFLRAKGLRSVPGQKDSRESFPSPLQGLAAYSGESPVGFLLFTPTEEGKLLLDLSFAPSVAPDQRMKIAKTLLEGMGRIEGGRVFTYARGSNAHLKSFLEQAGIQVRIGQPQPMEYTGDASVTEFLSRLWDAPPGARLFPDYETSFTMLKAMAKARPLFSKARVLEISPRLGTFGLAALEMFGAQELTAIDTHLWPLYLTRMNGLKFGRFDQIHVAYGLRPPKGRGRFEVALLKIMQLKDAQRLASLKGILTSEGTALVLVLKDLSELIRLPAQQSGLLIHPLIQGDRWEVLALTPSPTQLANLQGLDVKSAGLEEAILLPAGATQGRVILTPETALPALRGLSLLEPVPGEQIQLAAIVSDNLQGAQVTGMLEELNLTLATPIVNLSQTGWSLPEAIVELQVRAWQDQREAFVLERLDQLRDLGRFLQMPPVSVQTWLERLERLSVEVAA